MELTPTTPARGDLKAVNPGSKLKQHEDVAGFCPWATIEEKMARLTAELRAQTKESARLDKLICKNLESIGCVGPAVSHSFETIVKPLFDGLYESLEQSRSLAALRDTLLPKLISGELRVAEAERIVEDVA